MPMSPNSNSGQVYLSISFSKPRSMPKRSSRSSGMNPKVTPAVQMRLTMNT